MNWPEQAPCRHCFLSSFEISARTSECERAGERDKSREGERAGERDKSREGERAGAREGEKENRLASSENN